MLLAFLCCQLRVYSYHLTHTLRQEYIDYQTYFDGNPKDLNLFTNIGNVGES